VALPKAKSGLREQQEHRLPGSPCSIFRFVGNELGESQRRARNLGDLPYVPAAAVCAVLINMMSPKQEHQHEQPRRPCDHHSQ